MCRRTVSVRAAQHPNAVDNGPQHHRQRGEEHHIRRKITMSKGIDHIGHMRLWDTSRLRFRAQAKEDSRAHNLALTRRILNVVLSFLHAVNELVNEGVWRNPRDDRIPRLLQLPSHCSKTNIQTCAPHLDRLPKD